MKRQAAISTQIVRIGNSMGVRLPKTVREQAGLKRDVTLTVAGDSVVIRPKSNPRAGWAESIERAKSDRAKDDAIWDEYIPTAFDETEWTW